MAKLTDPVEQAVALLHDVIEDSTSDDLLNEGFPAEVVEAVVALTRLGGETYEAFIDRLSPNALARRVKQLDIEDNLNVLRLQTLNEADLRRVEKYHRAWHKLAALDHQCC